MVKIYSRKLKRGVERRIHFGIGRSTKTACGLVLYSRTVMVSIHSSWGGEMITADMSKVTCKRCLSTRAVRVNKLISLDHAIPGILDRESLCGEQWLLDHAMDIRREDVESQRLDVRTGNTSISLSNKIPARDRKEMLRAITGKMKKKELL